MYQPFQLTLSPHPLSPSPIQIHTPSPCTLSTPYLVGILKDFIAPACTISDDIDVNDHSPSIFTTTASSMGNDIVGSIISNIGNIASFIGSRISSQQPVVTGTSLAYDAAVGTGLDTLFAGSVRVTTNGPVPVPFVPPPVPPVLPVVVSISTSSQPQPLINLPTPCQTYEKWGIHTTLFLVSTWLVVASFFYMAAWYFASQASQQQDDDDDDDIYLRVIPFIVIAISNDLIPLCTTTIATIAAFTSAIHS